MSNALLRIPVTFQVADPTADAVNLIARVPLGGGQMRLMGASAALSAAVTSDATNHVGLRISKVGIDGAASPVNVTSNLGGASSAWVAATPRAFVLTDTVLDECKLLAGEYLKLTYDENGTVAPGTVTVFLEFAPGV